MADEERPDETRPLLNKVRTADNNTGSSLRRRSSAALPPFHEDFPSAAEPSSTLAIWTVVPILLLGVLIANADGSLVIASSQFIASEFNSLSDASWLVTSYVLAQCASQPLYGKLSDIFGRKANLVASYTFFALGCFICGIGRSFPVVLLGRALSGIGGAGMTALVSIIIADMVPVRSVAAWRAYVNVAATLGRSLGGPVGGWLTDTIGWRWSFYGQCPLTLFGLLLILWKLPTKFKNETEDENQTFRTRVKRVDFAGAVAIAIAISALLLTLDFVTNESPWYFSLVAGLLFLLFSSVFYLIERRWAAEPILPIDLIVKRDPLTAYLVAGFQIAAQFGLFYAVPIYYQVASGTSVTAAGARLVPAVVGNATGGLLSGLIISKTGKYKRLGTFASAAASVGYFLVLLRWRGHTGWAEDLYIFLGGFGSGVMQSTTFIHLAASLHHSEIAIAGTALYLAQNVFLLVGIQTSTAVLHASLRTILEDRLSGVKHKHKIIDEAVSNAGLIKFMPEVVRNIVKGAYVDSLRYSWGTSLILAFIGLLVGLTIREREL